MIASTQTNSPISNHGQTESPVLIATARLKAAGLRITQPRLTILAALVKFGRPTSIEAIHDGLGRRGCDLVTVYRCLAAFEEIGIVRRSFFHNGTSLFSLSVDNLPRYHVVSKSTKTVEELDPETARELHTALLAVEAKLRERGYTEISHITEFFGTAPSQARSQHAAMPAVDVR
jgi:Fur family ferric uptake transcriptional regulator